MFAFYAVTQFGSDPAILDVLGLKDSQSKGIIDPGTNEVEQQADMGRIKRLAEAYLKSKGLSVPEKTKQEDQDLAQLALTI